jgi:uncharacterized protein (TIGR01777 family)
MKVLVTGSSGLVGRALVERLASEGHGVARLVRTLPREPQSEFQWDPAQGRLDPAVLEGLDAAVHLGGENISAGRWTASQKERIRGSRVDSTRLLARTLAGLSSKPSVLVCASAIGYYGNRGEEILSEESGPGTGFLPEVCQAWEAASKPAEEAGIRVVRLRIGVVLSGAGGALPRMLSAFKLGLGGRLGSGRQYMSWIALEDLAAALALAITDDRLRGPVNAVAPSPVTNAEFTRVLAKVLGRPAVLPAPAFALRLLLGQMAEELLLASARVVPRKLKETGFRYRHPDVEGALRGLLA